MKLYSRTNITVSDDFVARWNGIHSSRASLSKFVDGKGRWFNVVSQVSGNVFVGQFLGYL